MRSKARGAVLSVVVLLSASSALVAVAFDQSDALPSRPFSSVNRAAATLVAQKAKGKSKQATPADRKYESTPQRLARGRYLAEHVTHCFACHSDVNWKAPGTPLVRGRKGAGAIFPDQAVPFPLLAPNITPDRATGAGSWSDEQLARAIREGVGHDGRTLFPVMPYVDFRAMSDDDLASVIVYLRSIRPVRNNAAKTPLPPPVAQALPPPMPITAPVPQPDSSDMVKRGEYLVRLADCVTCHTPVNERLEPRPELAFSGGRELKGPWGTASSANITPNPSGIPHYDEKMFVQMMRTGKVGGVRQLNSIMLWGFFRGMTDDDLKAIFAYVKTLKPIRHRVDNTEPPTPCRTCGGVHGMGNRN